ncbi:MAG: hypothetical protein AB7F78_14775, partial [Hyphomicrobiaceae bacterium]
LTPPSAPATPAAQRPAAAPMAPKAGGLGMWPLVAAAGALAVLGWYYFGQQKLGVVKAPAVPQIAVGGQNIAAELGSLAEGLRGTLGSMQDEASAKAALPRLQAMSTQLAGIGDSASKLSPDLRKTLATYAAQLLPTLRPLIEKALAAAGVGPVAKPVLDEITRRIEALARA